MLARDVREHTLKLNLESNSFHPPFFPWVSHTCTMLICIHLLLKVLACHFSNFMLGLVVVHSESLVIFECKSTSSTALLNCGGVMWLIVDIIPVLIMFRGVLDPLPFGPLPLRYDGGTTSYDVNRTA